MLLIQNGCEMGSRIPWSVFHHLRGIAPKCHRGLAWSRCAMGLCPSRRYLQMPESPSDAADEGLTLVGPSQIQVGRG